MPKKWGAGRGSARFAGKRRTPLTPLTPWRAAVAIFFFLLVPNTSPAAEAAGRTVTIAAVGDIMMGTDYPTPRLPPRGGRDLLAAAAPFLKRADLALGNLEGPLTTAQLPGKEPIPGRRYLFRTPPSYARNLKEAGFSMVSLANNHARDFGPEGLAETRRALEEAGILFSSKKGEVARFDVRGVKISVISLSYGPAPRSIVFPAHPLQEIATEARLNDIVIISVHAGAEGRGALHVSPGMERFLDEPRGDLVGFAHDAIDRGADLVLAHGPHVPRGLELYHGRLIAYSLGNFATCSGVSVAGESGYAPLVTAELAADGSFVAGSIESFRQSFGTGPRPDPKRRAMRLMRRLSAEDFPDSPIVFGERGALGVRR